MAVVTNLDDVNRYVTATMQQLYGNKLAKIVLFGSYARGDYHEESDVDYLVVLDEDEVSTSRELYKISPIMNKYYLDTFIHVSAFAVTTNQLIGSDKPFFREVRKDGKAVYERSIQ